jgi:hypothetical protein
MQKLDIYPTTSLITLNVNGLKYQLKKPKIASCQWLMPVILAT